MNDKSLEQDESAYHGHGAALLESVSAAIRPWLSHLIHARTGDYPNEYEQVIELVATDVERSIAELVIADPDVPLSGPLERIRVALHPLTEELDARGIARPHRDPVDREMRPDDHHGLGPMTFNDLGDEVHIAGITWGAAKAHVHLRRHRGPGTPGGASSS